MKYMVDVPYPNVKNIKKNPDLARLLMHLYAGEISEETLGHQYFFQSVILKDDYPEVAHVLGEISKVEMHHLKILAELIKALGVYPIFLDPVVEQHEFWTSKNVSYETEIIDLLLEDIEAEKQTILGYNSLIHVIEDDIVKAILKRIVLDERLHLEIFEKLYTSLL